MSNLTIKSNGANTDVRCNNEKVSGITSVVITQVTGELAYARITVINPKLDMSAPLNQIDHHNRVKLDPTRVILESPYRAKDGEQLANNVMFLNACIADSIKNHDEAPIASHGLYTNALNDDDERQRKLGIKCGLVWHCVADYMVVYTDLGITEGMAEGINNARDDDLEVVYRKLSDY